MFNMLCRIKLFSNVHSVSDGLRTDNGSEFHKVGPATAKLLWSYLVVMERGTTRSPRAAEQR